MNILIIDDDKNYLKTLSATVEQMCCDADIPVTVSTTTDPSAFIEKDTCRCFDVILLDIEMDAVSGIEVAAFINSKKGASEKPYVVFVTNKDSLVFDALLQQPYSFVRKSHINDLLPCLKRIYQKISLDDVYTIKTGRGINKLLIHEIIMLEKKNNYVLFFTKSGQFRERTTIDDKASDLSRYGFLRSQIGYLINVRYIDEILDSSVRLTDGSVVPLSKKYRKSLKQDFYEWMVNRR